MPPWKPILKGINRVTASEMEEILNSPQLQAVQQPIADHVGLPIIPHRHASDSLNVIYFLDWSAPTILDLLANRRDALITFGKKLAAHQDPPDEEDGEFPRGEEPDPRDRSVTIARLGLGGGFGITYLTFHHLVLLDNPKFLRDYLKSLRLPYATRFAKRLESMVNDH
jgi:hypothetical protein